MKTFSRSNQNKVFAGVCGGLSEYTNIDPLLIRLAFVISAFMGGAGIGIYILIWICTPLRNNGNSFENVEDTPYTDLSDADGNPNESHTVSDDAKDNLHENYQGRTDYERNENRRPGDADGRPYQKETSARQAKSKNVNPRNEGGTTATVFGIIIFLLGLFWLGEMFDLFHFRFRALLNLWPLILCFVGLNLIPMKRPIRITLNTVLIIAMVLLILYIGFCPEAYGSFNTCRFNCFWD